MFLLTSYRPAAAVVCAAALASLTACAGGTAAESVTESSPARAVAPSPTASHNGIEAKTTTEIYNLSHAANADAGSSRQRMSRANAASDLRVSATECTGTVTLTDVGSYDLVLKDNQGWIKPDTSFAKWMNAEAGEDLLDAGTWYHGTLDNHFVQSLTSYCHTDQFTSPDTLDASTKLTKKAVTTLDGQRVVPLVMEATGETVTWYAAATGRPYHVAQVSSRADMTDVTYSDFGTPVNARQPSGTVKAAPED
ncbi:hypothetical protein [Streptomyces sp. enrichment culture]|uniref:hypothetical protein n=1 Tax=Streptomyces sp. enrichment culture TaxID=1795815 RepID=UPI003F54F5C6